MVEKGIRLDGRSDGLRRWLADEGAAGAIRRSASHPAPGARAVDATGDRRGAQNPAFPFGAVIVRIADGHVLATGVNHSAANPTFHGEIVAINDYVARHGNRGWGAAILYTTGEPCPMCMSAMAWAGMFGVVWGTSIAKLRQLGIAQIAIPAAEVVGAAPFYHGQTVGHVLQAETDALFENRQRG